MEERSLRVYQQKTFFSKLGTTLSKILVPTRVGFNSIMISVKRIFMNFLTAQKMTYFYQI